MDVSELVTSDSGLTLVGAFLGGLWTLFKSQSWYRRIRQRRYFKAIQALEAGVEQTYRTYVRAIKESREDGQLTDEERHQARALARDAAVQFAETQGIDVFHELGADYLDLWIAKLVKRLKSGA